MKKIPKQLRRICDSLFTMVFPVCFCCLTFFSCGNNDSSTDRVRKEFEKQFKSVSDGDSTNSVMSRLGKPSRILEKPRMKERPDEKGMDATTTASLMALKNVYFEVWQYDTSTGEYGIVFKPVASMQKQLVVHSKYFPEVCPEQERK